ncbi:MAG TPA: acyl-CoA dehydrogenase family protein [Mycobacteriales bacterium]|jgi:alkylation response protein AidB-like acyl-CoA dehydrogenase|nr:acyl-CoA dehydrogenase family protein [Mycobacteriales bacterium]
MRLRPDPDALEFAASVRELLDRSCDVEALRAAWDSADGRVPGLWKRLAEMGATGLTIGESFGGSGMDLAAALPVLVESGRAALPEPMVETLAAARLLEQAGGDVASAWLPRTAVGSAVLALGPGPTGVVSAAEHADLLLLADADGAVFALERDAVQVTALPSVDTGVRLGTVSWSPGDAVARLDGADGLAVFDWAVVAVAAQLVGLAEAMLDMAVSYAKTREQFGVAIGTFQAVKHQLADAYVATSFARPVVNRAAWAIVQDLPSRSRDASHAKHAAAVAASKVARTALQVHGGIGYTFEHDLHMWLKRTWTLSALWGNTQWHKDRVSRLVLGVS